MGTNEYKCVKLLHRDAVYSNGRLLVTLFFRLGIRLIDISTYFLYSEFSFSHARGGGYPSLCPNEQVYDKYLTTLFVRLIKTIA